MAVGNKMLLALSLIIFSSEGKDLFQGDIILTKEQQMLLDENSGHTYGAMKTSLWPKVIPYELSPEIATSQKAANAISEALAEIEMFSCIKFKKRELEAGFMLFANMDPKRCWSPLGYVKTYRRVISLNQHCWHRGIVLHHLMHSLGFTHENNRPDRDYFIRIIWDNIEEVNHKHFYRKNPFSVNSMNVPYDYDSITHMNPWYLGKRDARGNILKTIVALDRKKKYSIGQRSHLSQSDILQLNLLYKCQGFTRPPNTLPPPPPTTTYLEPKPVVLTENICALRTRTFNCPYGSNMWIEEGMYGRLTNKICGYGSLKNMSCSSDVTAIVRKTCQNKMVCKVQVTDAVYGDPCPGTFKYLQLHYRCTKRIVACNLNVKEIRCPRNQVIYIADAMYGRKSLNVCPTIWDKTSDCKAETSLSVVRTNCHLKNHCKITANTRAFGEPCKGVRKYLEVRYQCIIAQS